MKVVIDELREMKLKKSAKRVERGIEETVIYCDFPSKYWMRIRTSKVIERLYCEICRRTRAARTIPNGNCSLMLGCGIWGRYPLGSKKYVNVASVSHGSGVTGRISSSYTEKSQKQDNRLLAHYPFV